MITDQKKFKNPKYVRLSKIAFWVTILISLPLFFLTIYTKKLTFGELLTFFFYSYIAIINFILGYRLNNPPFWSKWIMPAKWISEWKFLSNSDADTVEVKTNHKKLVRVMAGSVLLAIFLLATLSGKI